MKINETTEHNVFVYLFSHVSDISVSIFYNGWTNRNADKEYTCYYDLDYSNPRKGDHFVEMWDELEELLKGEN